MNTHAQLDHITPSFVDFDYLTPTMQALILDYLGTNTDVTFIDLEDDIPGFLGELTLRSSSDRNTILWRGVSSSAVHALCELERQGRIKFKETALHVYKDKGRTLSHAHWTPAVVKKMGI